MLTAQQKTNTNSTWIPAAPWATWRSRPSGTALVLNEREFVMANGMDKLFKYNKISDRWTAYLSLPPVCVIDSDDDDDHHNEDKEEPVYAVQIDHKNSRLVIVSSGWSYHQRIEKLTTSIVDLHSASLLQSSSYSVSIDEHDGETRRKSRCEWHQHRRHLAMVSVHGIIHKVDGMHSIWIETKSSWEPIKVSREFRRYNSATVDVTLIHVPSKDIVLMIGGYHQSGDIDWNKKTIIWQYRVTSGMWEEMKDQQHNSVELEPGEYDAVLSSNERFVIIVRKECDYHFQILEFGDNDQCKLWQSPFVLPEPVVVMTKSGGSSEIQVLVFGWIRKHRAAALVPKSIMTLISEWCPPSSVEMIHCFTEVSWDLGYARKHLMIPLTDIVCSEL